MVVRRFCAAILLAAGLEGCSSAGPETPHGVCDQQFLAVEARAEERGIHVSEPRAVPAYPVLGTNRLLASFDPAQLSDAEREDWLRRLANAGQQRHHLLQRLLADDPHAQGVDGAGGELSACASAFVQAFPRTGEAWAALGEAVRVPDDYRSWQRALGLYPLTGLGVRAGVAGLQREIEATFDAPLAALEVRGELRRYTLATANGGPGGYGPLPEATRPGQLFDRDALGPRVSTADANELDGLFATHAPILEIDTAGTFDRPGAPYWTAAPGPLVATERPVGYRYLSLAHFAGELRVQLNYLFWFPERPAQAAWDILAGTLDGLHWRVTLDDDGRVLLYDSVHACGCYHQFFPGRRVRLRDAARALPEPPLVPQAAPALSAGERLVLRVASVSHYLQRVYADVDGVGAAVTPYELMPYTALYAVDAPGGTRSLFADHGIIPGTARAERWYLWPMGVRSPGAMRERGRHATAFLGRRHFDDGGLLDALFEPLFEPSGQN